MPGFRRISPTRIVATGDLLGVRRQKDAFEESRNEDIARQAATDAQLGLPGKRFGFSVDAIRQCESHRRRIPAGPTGTLLWVIARERDAVTLPWHAAESANEGPLGNRDLGEKNRIHRKLSGMARRIGRCIRNKWQRRL
jgi:hypothetical protein